MPLLTVALEDGFTNDLVIIRVDDREVFRKEDVNTRILLGYADSFEVEVPEGYTMVEVLIPMKRLAETIALQVSGVIYLGLSVEDLGISHRISDQPFGYM